MFRPSRQRKAHITKFHVTDDSQVLVIVEYNFKHPFVSLFHATEPEGNTVENHLIDLLS